MSATARLEITLPQITAENLAKLRRTRPLANLGPSTGRALPTAHVSAPPDHAIDWPCWVPGPVDGRSCVVHAKYFYDARMQAAVVMHCEPGEVRIGGRA